MSDVGDSDARPSWESLSNKPGEAKYFTKYLDAHEQGVVRNLAAEQGFTELTQTQHEAFLNGALSETNNLLIAQTGNGKTFVAEGRSKKTLDNYGTVAYLVPSKRLQTEKLEGINSWTDDDIEVGGADAKYSDADILVKTFDSFFTALIHGVPAAKTLDLVVFDDFHDLYDERNGSKIEKAIAMADYYDIPIFALSATIGNPFTIADWFDGEAIISDEPRCKPLEEHSVYHPNFDSKDDAIVATAATHAEKSPMLMFNNSRRSSKRRALKVAEEQVFTQPIPEATKERYEEEIRSTVGGDLTEDTRDLIKCLKNGVAFHHAGLPADIRTYIIDEFKDADYLRCICCTPTLAYGFDADVHTIIVSDLHRWTPDNPNKPVHKYEYIQWIGRAARTGTPYDEGHIYIIHKDEDLLEKYEPGVQPKDKTLPPVESAFANAGEALNRTLLQLISANWDSEQSLIDFMKHTLFWQYLENPPDDAAITRQHANPEKEIETTVKKSLRWLNRNDFITQPTTGTWQATARGQKAAEFYERTWEDVSLESLNRLWKQFNGIDDLTREGLLYRISETFSTQQNNSGVLNLDVTGDPAEKLPEYVANLQLPGSAESSRPTATVAFLLGEWCQGITPAELENRFDTQKSRVQQTAEFHGEILFAAKGLITSHPDVEEPSWYDSLQTQITEGLPATVVPALEIDEVGRQTAHSLHNHLSTISNMSGEAASDWERTGPTVIADLHDFFHTELDGDRDRFITHFDDRVDHVGETTAENILGYLDDQSEDRIKQSEFLPNDNLIDSLPDRPNNTGNFTPASDLTTNTEEAQDENDQTSLSNFL